MENNRLWFDGRIKLKKVFENWCEENHAARTPVSMISFLASHGLVNVERVEAFLENYDSNGNR